MDFQEAGKLFFEYIKDKKPTAENIKSGAASISREPLSPALIDMILSYALAHNINPEKELAELYAAQTKAKNEAEEKNRRENLKVTIKGLITNLSYLTEKIDTAAQNELTETLAAIGKDAAGLITTGATVNRFPTWKDYETAWQKETDRDFSPAMFDNLPFPEGTVSYIGARTGRGKTTAMVNIGIEALFPPDTKTNPRRVLFVSLEESQKQIIRRFSLCLAYRNADTATRAQLDTITNPFSKKRDPKNAYKQFKRKKDIGVNDYGNGAAAFMQAINKADTEIKKAVETGNLIFFDGIGAGFSETIAAVRNRGKGDIVLLDYIQKIPSGEKSFSGNPDLERIRRGSEALIEAAISAETVVIAGAQFNREGQKGSPKKDDEFTDADFRGCGDLEQDGHNLLGIGRSKDKSKHYYGIIKSREGEVTDKLYTLDFAGGYSYMGKGDGTYTPPPPPKGRNSKKTTTVYNDDGTEEEVEFTGGEIL